MVDFIQVIIPIFTVVPGKTKPVGWGAKGKGMLAFFFVSEQGVIGNNKALPVRTSIVEAAVVAIVGTVWAVVVVAVGMRKFGGIRFGSELLPQVVAHKKQRVKG